MPNLLSAPSSNAFSQNAVTPKASTSSPFNPQTPQTDQFGRLTSLMPKASSGINFGAVTNGNVSSLGVRAAAPGNNVTAPKTTIPASQTAPPSQQPVPAQQGPLQATNPNAAFQNNVGGSTGTPQTTPSSVVGLLSNFANTNPTAPAQQGLMQNLVSPQAQQYNAQTAQYGAGNIPIGQQAEGIASNAQNSINQVAQQAAQGGIGMLTGGALNPIALGRAGAIENQAAQEQQALAAAAQVGLQGTSQALTGQGQAANASNAAAGQALSQLQQTQSGLNQAGTLANQGQQTQQSAATSLLSNMPQALQYGAYGASNLSPSTYLPQLAQQVRQGLISPADANNIANSAYGGAGSTMLNQQLNGTGFNYNTAAGNSAAQQSVAQTGGTAVQSANQNVLNTATSNLASLTNLANNITSTGNLAIQSMAGAGIDPTNSRWANTTINQMLTQFNSPQYQQFNTALQALQTQVSQLINTGQDLSTSSSGANAIVGGGATLGTLQATVSQLQKETGTLVANQKSIANSAQSAVTGGSSTGSSSFTDQGYYGTQ